MGAPSCNGCYILSRPMVEQCAVALEGFGPTRKQCENRLVCTRGFPTRPDMCTQSFSSLQVNLCYFPPTLSIRKKTVTSFFASTLYSTLTLLYSLSLHLTQPSGLKTLSRTLKILSDFSHFELVHCISDFWDASLLPVELRKNYSTLPHSSLVIVALRLYATFSVQCLCVAPLVITKSIGSNLFPFGSKVMNWKCPLGFEVRTKKKL